MTAADITGGLSHESKMPGPAWGIPASSCHRGKHLAQQEGTTCSKCYALKNFYNMSNVRTAFDRRLRALNHPEWVDHMVELVEPHHWFRWFGSGDIQGVRNLHRIFDVCERTPHTNHWLPTRERGYVKRVLKTRRVPGNLALRLSMDRINAPLIPNGFDLPVSAVSDNGQHDCPSHLQGNSCGRCRRCWDPTENVTYRKH